MGWEQVLMLTVLILVSYAGIKTINHLFDSKKKKNSLF